MRRYVLMLGALVAAVGCTSTPASTPSESTNTEQLVKYYRKKNDLAPSAKLAVTGLHDSSITGAKEGTLEIGEGAGAEGPRRRVDGRPLRGFRRGRRRDRRPLEGHHGEDRPEGSARQRSRR